MPTIHTKVNVLRSGAASVEYSVEISARRRIVGVVMFDANGRYFDATRSTASTTGRGFCEQHELPKGVLEAAKQARRAAMGES